MLVISRRVMETVRIGDDVEVTVVRIGPNSVRLAINAPKEMNIVRTELADKHPIQPANVDEIGLRSEVL